MISMQKLESLNNTTKEKSRHCLSLLISDQIRLKQAFVDKIHTWIEICELGTRTTRFIYYMTNKKIADKPADFRPSKTHTTCTDASLARDMCVRFFKK